MWAGWLWASAGADCVDDCELDKAMGVPKVGYCDGPGPEFLGGVAEENNELDLGETWGGVGDWGGELVLIESSPLEDFLACICGLFVVDDGPATV